MRNLNNAKCFYVSCYDLIDCTILETIKSNDLIIINKDELEYTILFYSLTCDDDHKELLEEILCNRFSIFCIIDSCQLQIDDSQGNFTLKI